MTARWPYVAVFMDCAMPEVDGYTAARKIAHREGLGPHTPVIAITSRPRSVCMAAGMDHYLAKPLRLDALRNDLTRLGLRAGERDDPAPAMRPLGANPPADAPLVKEIPEQDRLQQTTAIADFLEQAILWLPQLWRAANTSDGPALQRIANDLGKKSISQGAVRVADLSDRMGKAVASGATSAAVLLEPQLRQALIDTAATVRADREVHAAQAVSAIDAIGSDPLESVPDIDDMTALAPVRVAIADDDPLARFAIEAMIERADGLTLVGGADGVEEIVELAAVRRPDVVVLDWMMPGGGGPGAARRIREWSPDVVIVGLTASASPDAYIEMVSAGASGFLVKGGSADKLAGTIERAVGASHAR